MIRYDPILQKLESALFIEKGLFVDVLRLDLIHPEVSGNKWFKLKNNLAKAAEGNFDTVLTFGGAFSNHIAATAAACKAAGLRSIGVIRGERPGDLNPTLALAKENGMRLHFIDRETYLQKNSESLRNSLAAVFGSFYLIPEGGNNEAGISGCTGILKNEWSHDYLFCAVGTGATFAGILASAKPHQTVVGVSVLKGKNTLPSEVEITMQKLFPATCGKIAGNEELESSAIRKSLITNNYCFSGYGRCDLQLVEFKRSFEAGFNIPLDHIYTAKLFFAFCDLAAKGKVMPGSRVLLIHSGGLQGNKGFEERFL